MKLKYILASIAASVSMFVGCTEEEPVSKLEGLEVSNDYITLSAEENSSATLTVTADDAWAATASSDWVKVEPASGSAGQTVTMTLSASAAKAARNTDVRIKMGSKTKIIYVNQLAPAGVEVPPATAKEIMEGPDKNYKITGVVMKITSTSYGNWYINDGTVEGDGVYIYGTLNKKGAAYDKTNPSMENLNCPANPNAWDLSVGDKVTVEGPKTVYNGVVELVNVTILKIEKSLVQATPSSIALETPDAGTFEVTVSSKVNGVTPIVSAAWIKVTDVAASGGDFVYTFAASANDKTSARSATIAFKAPGAITSVTVNQPGAEPLGAMNVAELVAQITSTDSKNPSTYKADFREAKDVVVSYVNGSNAYIEDKTGAVFLYLKDHGLSAGQKLTGFLSGTGYIYNGLPEITALGTEFTAAAGGEIPCTEMTLADLLADFKANISRRILIKGVSVTDAIDCVTDPNKPDRDGKISQDGSEIALRAQIKKDLKVDAGTTGDIIVYPCPFKENKQLSFWANEDFVK